MPLTNPSLPDPDRADLVPSRPSRSAARERERRERLARRSRRRQRRRLVVSAFLIAVLLGTTAYTLDSLAAPDSGAVGEPTPATPLPSPSPSPTAPPTPTPPPVVLSLPGNFPAEGPGTFDFVAGEGEVLGTAGPVRRFRLGVESNVDEDLVALAEFVDATLGAEQGWTAAGELRFQRVPDGAGNDFTIYLATTGTTAQMCATGGLNVVAPDLPEGGVSCYVLGHVILNLHRWRTSVPHYVDEEVPLEVYRQMVLNHEVGHHLGHGHVACPEPGGPAPVMQQQTLSLQGCEAYPWPYLDGERLTGPAVP